MQATIVMLIALGGLGCQNPADEVPAIPPVAVQPAAPSAGYIPGYDPAPAGFTGCSSAVCGNGRDPLYDDSLGRCLRDTFASFIIGRDPDVPSVRQIEADYCAGNYSR